MQNNDTKIIEILKKFPDKNPHPVIQISVDGILKYFNDSSKSIIEFYDGIIFHRVIPGFMAQTGDPDGNGMGGSGQKLKAEFSDYSYREGTVGMARTSNPDSADSQFFICYDGCSHLTGQYTVWGQVSDGMDNVYKISAGEPPIEPDRIISASISE